MRLNTRTQTLGKELSRHNVYMILIKPLFDILLSTTLLILTSPLFLVIALGIKLHSKGPVFYRQQRVGFDGKSFEMLKFRSMRVNADQKLHQQYVKTLILKNTRPEELGTDNLKLASDPRITGLGKILRGFGLDELPQLINVLRGEMSIVGPRPSLLYEYEVYQPWHKKRLQVLPGITGLWQVTAHNQVPFDEMVKIDLDYIRNLSFFLDLKIMILTPLEMLRKKG